MSTWVWMDAVCEGEATDECVFDPGSILARASHGAIDRSGGAGDVVLPGPRERAQRGRRDAQTSHALRDPPSESRCGYSRRRPLHAGSADIGPQHDVAGGPTAGPRRDRSQGHSRRRRDHCPVGSGAGVRQAVRPGARDEPDGTVEPGESIHLAETETAFWQLAAFPQTVPDTDAERFVQYLQRMLRHNAPLTAPVDVAWFLASYARDAKARIEHRALPGLTSVR